MDKDLLIKIIREYEHEPEISDDGNRYKTKEERLADRILSELKPLEEKQGVFVAEIQPDGSIRQAIKIENLKDEVENAVIDERVSNEKVCKELRIKDLEGMLNDPEKRPYEELIKDKIKEIKEGL